MADVRIPPMSYDDRPIHSEPGALPPEMQAPLAVFEGAEPPAPQWFRNAVAQAPDRTFVTSMGSQIELLTWGRVGAPGVLLVHGNSAHADWWSYIAPFLAEDHRVAAMSLAGMGQSDWRERYSFDFFAEDAEACARAAGLYEGPRKPTYVGHSFGGSQVFFAATRFPERMNAAILVDTGLSGPPPEAQERLQRRADQARNIPSGDRVGRIYPTEAAALARFRLMPPQIPGNLFIADFIARRSLKQVPLEDGSGLGWTWRFDPEMWTKLDHGGLENLAALRATQASIPVLHLLGDRSGVIERRRSGEISPLPEGTPEILIPDSAHHVMIDQPLALVAALRALLATWAA